MLKRFLVAGFVALTLIDTTPAHNNGINLTWNRDISRVFLRRCADCHREGGGAFSLMTYPEVQPRLTEIKHQVLNRRMPPWGAVKGFGDFRNEQALTQEEIEMISDWIDADAPRGNNRALLPAVPKFSKPARFSKPKDALQVRGDLQLIKPFILDGIYPDSLPEGTTTRITARFPDARVEPLLWIYEWDPKFPHPFLFQRALELPAGTIIRGVPAHATIHLLPGKKPPAKSK